MSQIITPEMVKQMQTAKAGAAAQGMAQRIVRTERILNGLIEAMILKGSITIDELQGGIDHTMGKKPAEPEKTEATSEE